MTFFWLTSLLIFTHNFGFIKGILVESWIEQYQDHFDYWNDKTWLMRSYEDAQFYDQSGPIFIMIGGEYELTRDIVESNYIMYEMAGIYGAMIYAIEHRYYGKSQPVSDTSFENLRYLRITQVLADIVLFVEVKKKELDRSNVFVMVFGCSYAGNLAAWMRVAYPNVVNGALASSAPVYIKANFFEFFVNVGKTIRSYDENCATIIHEGFLNLEELLKDPVVNSNKVSHDFKLCSSDFSKSADVPFLMYALAKIFADIVMNNEIEMNGKTSIENVCIWMTENEAISSYLKLAAIFKEQHLGNHSCIFLKYRFSLEKFLETSWESETIIERLWLYQTCTELGYRQTFSSTESIFGSVVTEEYFTQRCRDLFGDIVNVEYLDRNIQMINYLYNSKLFNTENIIFTNGELDPWRSLSVLSDLNLNSPAIFMNDAAHCEIVNEGPAPEKESIISARCQVAYTIHEWLHKWLKNLNK